MKLIKNLLGIATVAVITLSTTNVKAQEVDFGADVVSQYVWRGTQFGARPSRTAMDVNCYWWSRAWYLG